MDCEKFDKSSMELLYGELDELSEAAAQRHLHHCTRCREIWGHLRTTRELSELPLEEPPEDLFGSILEAEQKAHQSLPARERFSRAVSIMAGIAMRPQVAMAAILLLMIGSSLVFVRADRAGRGQVSVTEVGAPNSDSPTSEGASQKALVFEAGQSDVTAASPSKEPTDETGTGDRSDKKSAASNGTSETDTEERVAYNTAMAAYQQGSYAEAERLFSEIASLGGPQAATAALHEGHAARNGAGCQRAAALYDAVAEQFAGRTVASEASWHAASCYRALGQTARAKAHYQALSLQGAYAERAKRALEELKEGELVANAKTSPDANPVTAGSEAVGAGKTAPSPHDAAASPEQQSGAGLPKASPRPAASGTEVVPPGP